MRQVDGVIGQADATAVADLVSRRVAADLLRVEWLREAGLQTATQRTSGGTASVVAWLPVPGATPGSDAWLCVDLRATDRADPSMPWLLRLGVEVEQTDGRPLQQARADAHDLVVPIRRALTCSALRAALAADGCEGLGEALTPWPRTFDGLRGDPDEATLGAWRERALTSDKPGAHPALYHDWGRRLATQIRLDVLRVDRQQLVELLDAALRHLAEAGRQQAAAGQG